MINLCNKGNLLCRKLIYNNSIYEEDKAIIHKNELIIVMSFIDLEETRYR